jgi:hypothetical protein
MIRKTLTTTIACAAMAVTVPAVAQQAHGGGNANVNASTHMGGPSQTGINARINSQGSLNASPNAITRSSPNSVLQTNSTTTTTTNATTKAPKSQGLQHASPTGIAHASPKSVLAAGAVASTTLPGLTTGLTVQTSAATTHGTATQLNTGTDGSIRGVVVSSDTRQTYTLSGTSLSISGSTVTTTSM